MGAKYVIDEYTLRDIADSIREKTGSTLNIAPEDMAEEILRISGAEDLNDVLTEQENLITTLKRVITSIEIGGEPTPTQEKTIDITENGTVEVTPDDGYALSKVTANINVPTGGGEANMNTCTVVIDVPSKANYYICYEAVSGGAITYNITKHYTDSNITKTVRCDSVINVVAGTIKGATVTDGEVLRIVSGQGAVYGTPSTAGVTVEITFTA